MCDQSSVFIFRKSPIYKKVKSRVHAKYHIIYMQQFILFYCPQKISQPSNFYHFRFRILRFRLEREREKKRISITTLNKPEYFILENFSLSRTIVKLNTLKADFFEMIFHQQINK